LIYITIASLLLLVFVYWKANKTIQEMARYNREMMKTIESMKEIIERMKEIIKYRAGK